MTIEAEIQALTKQVHQQAAIIQDLGNIIKSAAAFSVKLENVESTLNVDGQEGTFHDHHSNPGDNHAHQANAALPSDENNMNSGHVIPDIESTIDYDNLDAMKCPFDSTKMAAGGNVYAAGNKLAFCHKKKRDESYSMEQYVADRRVLIEDAAQRAALSVTLGKVKDTAEGDSSEEQIDSSNLDNDDSPPQTINDSPAPQNAVNNDYIELPSIPDFEAISDQEFIDLCQVLVSKHGADALAFVTLNMKQCGLGPVTHETSMQQDQRTWVTRRVINYDITNS